MLRVEKDETQAFSLLGPRTLGRSAKQRGQQRQVELCYTAARESGGEKGAETRGGHARVMPA